MDDALLRGAAIYGPEFVVSLLALERSLQLIAQTVREAAQADPASFALAPPPTADPHASPPA